MRNIEVLDCTLRDGGYINNWEFDNFNLNRIVDSLVSAKVELIECGYISKKAEIGKERTVFFDIEDIEDRVKKFNGNCTYVAMINHGEYNVEDLKPVNEKSKVQGIRVVFRKNDWKSALNDVEVLCQKGYKVFVQPMATLNYSDKEILELVNECNKFDIYAFYIVDSFGAMKNDDVKHLSLIVNRNLNKTIKMGFHAHNNLQLAHPNAVEFIQCAENRNIIIDASIFGMGRGAGNLTTELICNHLNVKSNKEYKVEPILAIIDKYISRIYSQNYWGYSIGHYLSAINNCHPNYATYLVNKKTLTVTNMEEILKHIDPDKKLEFDKAYIEELYLNYNSKMLTENDKLITFKQKVLEKDICLLAPGRSLIESLNKISKINTVKIGVNHILDTIDYDYYFFSNQKRYIEYKEKMKNVPIQDKGRKFIFTSNIEHDEADFIVVNYSDVLGVYPGTKDNAAIMLLNILMQLNISDVFIAGFDGYGSQKSYIEENMEFDLNRDELEKRNIGIINELNVLKDKMNLFFIGETIYSDNHLESNKILSIH